MVSVDEFRTQVIVQCLEDEEEKGTDIFVRPGLKIRLNKERCETCRTKFIEGIQQIPDIEKGLSYIKMAGYGSFFLDQGEALVCQAIGKLLGLWTLFPTEKMEKLFEMDPIGAFPLNTGLKEKI